MGLRYGGGAKIRGRGGAMDKDGVVFCVVEKR